MPCFHDNHQPPQSQHMTCSMNTTSTKLGPPAVTGNAKHGRQAVLNNGRAFSDHEIHELVLPRRGLCKLPNISFWNSYNTWNSLFPIYLWVDTLQNNFENAILSYMRNVRCILASYEFVLDCTCAERTASIMGLLVLISTLELWLRSVPCVLLQRCGAVSRATFSRGYLLSVKKKCCVHQLCQESMKIVFTRALEVEHQQRVAFKGPCSGLKHLSSPARISNTHSQGFRASLMVFLPSSLLLPRTHAHAWAGGCVIGAGVHSR